MTKHDTTSSNPRNDDEDVDLHEETIADLDADAEADPKGGYSSQCMSLAQME